MADLCVFRTQAARTTHMRHLPYASHAVEEANAFAVRKGKSGVKTWAANPDLFPCSVSDATLDKARAVIKVRLWPLHMGCP